MQTCTVYVFFITFCTNANNYCTLAIEMNGIPKFFPSIIGLLMKDTLRGTDLTRRLAITSAPVG